MKADIRNSTRKSRIVLENFLWMKSGLGLTLASKTSKERKKKKRLLHRKCHPNIGINIRKKMSEGNVSLTMKIIFKKVIC